MNPFDVLQFVNLFFAGIVAGIEFVIHFGVQGSSAGLDDHAQLMLRQGLVRRLRVLVPSCFLPALLSGVWLTVLGAGSMGGGFRYAALVALLVWVGLRVIGTVPINKATLNWNPLAPPLDWKAQIARAERFHVVGVLAVVFSFGCFLLSAAVTWRVPQ